MSINELNERCKKLKPKVINSIDEFVAGFPDFPGLKHKETNSSGTDYSIKFMYLGSAFLAQIRILKDWKDNIDKRTANAVYALEVRENIDDSDSLCNMKFDFRGKPIDMIKVNEPADKMEHQVYLNFTKSVVIKLISTYNL